MHHGINASRSTRFVVAEAVEYAARKRGWTIRLLPQDIKPKCARSRARGRHWTAAAYDGGRPINVISTVGLLACVSGIRVDWKDYETLVVYPLTAN